MKLEKLKKDIVSVPVSEDVMERLVYQGLWNRHDIMRHHPGHGLENSINSLKIAYETYKQCYKDLVNVINSFHDSTEGGEILHRSNSEELFYYKSSLRKEIFSISSSASSLVEMSRRVIIKANDKNSKNISKIIIPDYDCAVSSFFDENQHAFIKQLRNNMNHEYFHDVSWRIRFSGKLRESQFIIKCDEIKNDCNFSGKSLAYISGKDFIDIRYLFDDYSNRIVKFYDWLIKEIESRIPLCVSDYRRCIRLWDRNISRIEIGILCQIVSDSTDIYSYLPKIFTLSEMKEINALKHRSKEQVDKIISIYDKYEACDDVMRAKIYAAFRVAA